MEPIIFTGYSGRKYNYLIPQIGPGFSWLHQSGNYAFVRIAGLVHPLYFGECEDFATRGMPPAHERWAEAVQKYGATHLLSHLTPGPELTRKAEEKDLIAAYNPPMNVQHRTGLAGTPAAPKNQLAAALRRYGKQ
jgi:hypothetical protein